MKKKPGRKITPLSIFYVFGASIWFVAAAFPFYFTLISSFKEDPEIFRNFIALPVKFHFENYVMAEKMSGIIRATINSLIVSIAAIAIMIFVIVMASYVISRKRIPFSGGISAFLIAALMIPIQSTIVPIVQMVSAIGQRDNLTVLTIIYAGLNTSLVFFVMKNYIDGISREIDEAAVIDGCSMLQLVFRIIVPIAKPSIATCSIVSFLSIYNEYPIANVLISKQSLKTISVALLNFKGNFGTFFSINFAAIIISIIPTVVFYILAQEKVEKSITSGAIKG